MATDITYRTATINDYELVCRLLRELDDHHIGIRPDVFQAFDGPTRSRDEIARWVASEDAAVLVAEIGTDMIGLATVQVSGLSSGPMFRPGQRARMDNLIVRREFQGRGIGRSLLERVIEWAHARQLESVDINVWTDNESGMGFFKSSGFQPLYQRMELRIDKNT